MQSRRKFFRYLAFSLEIILLWVLQSTPRLLPEFFGAKAFLLLAAALSISVCEDVIPALIWGAVCGVFADISAGGKIGYFAVAFTLVCFAQSALLDSYLNRNPLTGSVLSLGSTVAVIGLYFVFFRLWAGIPDCAALFFPRYPVRMGMTFLCFFPLYFLYFFLYRTFN